MGISKIVGFFKNNLFGTFVFGVTVSVVAAITYGFITNPDPPPLKGEIDMIIYRVADQSATMAKLSNFPQLPILAGDRVRVEAHVNREAFIYVLWIGTDGSVEPIYPWSSGDWDTVPQAEMPKTTVHLPKDANQTWVMDEGTGMETLVLLLREKPLPRNTRLESLIGKIPPQTYQSDQAIIWFANGEIDFEGERGPKNFSAEKVNDPVLETQVKLHI